MIAPRTYRAALPAIGALVAIALVGGCTPDDLASDGGDSASGGTNGGARSAEGFGASPLDNPDGTKPGLGIDGIPLARNGCDTRIISMARAVVGLFSQRMQGVVGCA